MKNTLTLSYKKYVYIPHRIKIEIKKFLSRWESSTYISQYLLYQVNEKLMKMCKI